MRSLLWMVALLVAPIAAQAPVPAPWPRSRPASWADLSYPSEALAARVTGRVVVSVTTDASGRVVGAEALSGPPSLVPAVLDNARQWTLSPGVQAGAIVYRFEIDPGACNDDSRSLFRLAQPNLAVVTACTGPGRAWPPSPANEFQVNSSGAPIYPPIAQSARLSGVVVLELTVDRRGAFVDARPLTQLPFLTDAAIAHLKTWRVEPGGRRRGIVVYEFSLDNPACEITSPSSPREHVALFWVTSDYRRINACSRVIDVAQAPRGAAISPGDIRVFR